MLTVSIYLTPVDRPGRAAQSAAAHRLLADELAVRGIPSHAQIFTISPNGRPALAEYPQILFSITHTDTIAAVAMAAADGEWGEREPLCLGLDAEPIDRRPASPRFAARFFSAAEQASPRPFALTWTRKEAMLKALDLHTLPDTGTAAPGLHFTTLTAYRHYLTVCTSMPAKVELVER